MNNKHDPKMRGQRRSKTRKEERMCVEKKKDGFSKNHKMSKAAERGEIVHPRAFHENRELAEKTPPAR